MVFVKMVFYLVIKAYSMGMMVLDKKIFSSFANKSWVKLVLHKFWDYGFIAYNVR